MRDFSEQNLIQTLNEVFANKMSGGKAANRLLYSCRQFIFNTLLSTWLFLFSAWLFHFQYGFLLRNSMVMHAVVVYHKFIWLIVRH